MLFSLKFIPKRPLQPEAARGCCREGLDREGVIPPPNKNTPPPKFPQIFLEGATAAAGRQFLQFLLKLNIYICKISHDPMFFPTNFCTWTNFKLHKLNLVDIEWHWGSSIYYSIFIFNSPFEKRCFLRSTSGDAPLHQRMVAEVVPSIIMYPQIGKILIQVRTF
jgi:hypothetical protein